MVSIIADSTCDLSKELIEKYHINILPLQVMLGEQEYQDGVDITPDLIYRWSDQNGQTPKTSAVTTESAMTVFQRELERSEELIVITISSGFSSSYQVCRLAAEKTGAGERIHVIDSKNLSTGIGLLVIRAAIMAGEGKSAKEIEEQVLLSRPRVRSSFVVDTLTYLHRGGRCSGLTAMLGGVLKIHPRISVSDGVLSPGKKYRGAVSRYILDYVKDMESDLKQADKDRVFITHSGCDEETVRLVEDYIRSLDHFDDVLITRAGSVISSHCGPGTLGVLYEASPGL